MTKEEAYKMAEKFLIRAYGSDNPEYVAMATTAVADKDAWKIIEILESFIKFENDIIDALKKIRRNNYEENYPISTIRLDDGGVQRRNR